MTAELYPLPLPALADRLVRELDAGGTPAGSTVYGMPRASVWTPDPARNIAIDHLGQRLGTPLGPAAGPHTQLAQNIVLAWLGGARFLELKTVQILDELQIPRPCIHVPHVGYNVEWSQELRVAESASEYAKAWILVHLAASRLQIPVDAIFDLSVGYDLAGIQSEKVAGFLRRMADATPLLDTLRAELPPTLRVDTPSCISRSLTLSTFHGCPAHEIEAISTHLMRAHHLDVIVKLNPTLLGEAEVRALLHDQLGYRHIGLDPHAFAKDLQWDQLLDMLPRLRRVAAEEGVGLGVKFSNTLVCRSPEPPFGDGEMYLSGAPLHVLAATLAARFLAETRGEIPVTFSAGVDAQNFVGVLAAGIAPVTACTDLLKGKGYGKLCGYLRGLEKHLATVGAADLAGLPRVDATTWAAAAAADPRYSAAQNRVAPRKVGSHLVLLDCLTCDKCVPICPNTAIQTFPLPLGPVPSGRVQWGDGVWSVTPVEAPPTVSKRHQIGIVADLCNRCGQCDPICPEDGGPFQEKPNLFLDPRAWADHPERAGLHYADGTLWWRRSGTLQGYTPGPDGRATWTTPSGTLTLAADATGVPHILSVTGAGVADLADAALLVLLWAALPAADGWRPTHTSLSLPAAPGAVPV